MRFKQEFRSVVTLTMNQLPRASNTAGQYNTKTCFYFHKTIRYKKAKKVALLSSLTKNKTICTEKKREDKRDYLMSISLINISAGKSALMSAR